MVTCYRCRHTTYTRNELKHSFLCWTDDISLEYMTFSTLKSGPLHSDSILEYSCEKRNQSLRFSSELMKFLSNIWSYLLSNQGLCTLITYWSILIKEKGKICCHLIYYEVKVVWYNLANVSPYFHYLETSIHFSIWYHNFKLKIIFQIYHMSKCPSFHDMLHDGVSTSLHRAHQAPN